MTQTQADAFLTGGGSASAKFPTIGSSVTGTIAKPPTVSQQTDIKTGKPLVWDNGDPREQLVVTLQTALRDNGEDDDGLRSIYVKGSKKAGSQSLHDAVRGAVQAAGAKGLEVGGTLTVTYIGDGIASGPGMDPPKQYSASYASPSGAGFLGTEQVPGVGQVSTSTGEIAQPPVQPAAQPVAQPAAAPTSGPVYPPGITAEMVAAVRAQGLDPTQIFPGFRDAA